MSKYQQKVKVNEVPLCHKALTSLVFQSGMNQTHRSQANSTRVWFTGPPNKQQNMWCVSVLQNETLVISDLTLISRMTSVFRVSQSVYNSQTETLSTRTQRRNFQVMFLNHHIDGYATIYSMMYCRATKQTQRHAASVWQTRGVTRRDVTFSSNQRTF